MNTRLSRQGGAASDPRTIGDACDAWLVASGLTSAKELGSITSCWRDAIAREVADHVVPVSLDDGELVVVVDHPGWATEMAFLGPDILASLERHLGRRVANRIKVTVRR